MMQTINISDISEQEIRTALSLFVPRNNSFDQEMKISHMSMLNQAYALLSNYGDLCPDGVPVNTITGVYRPERLFEEQIQLQVAYLFNEDSNGFKSNGLYLFIIEDDKDRYVMINGKSDSKAVKFEQIKMRDKGKYLIVDSIRQYTVGRLEVGTYYLSSGINRLIHSGYTFGCSSYETYYNSLAMLSHSNLIQKVFSLPERPKEKENVTITQ